LGKDWEEGGKGGVELAKGCDKQKHVDFVVQPFPGVRTTLCVSLPEYLSSSCFYSVLVMERRGMECACSLLSGDVQIENQPTNRMLART